MDASIAELITIGLSVNICRSDGRVHAASVKAVHQMKSAVSVEWIENSATKGKDVEFGELWSLNKELFEYLKSCSQEDPAPSRRHAEGVRRETRIPAPSDSSNGAAELSASVRRKSARRTCLLPVAVSQPSNTDHGALSPEVPKPSSSNGSGAASRELRKKGLAKQAPALSQVTEEDAERQGSWEEARGGPALTAARRRSVVSAEAERTRNKREATQARGIETQAKRGKDGDMHRPNWQFYKMIEEYRESMEVVPISESVPVEPHRICVCVRKRPLSGQEVTRKEIDVVSVPGRGVLLVHEPKQKVDLTKYLENQAFRFDYSFDETATNDIVYRFTAKPLVRTIFEGGMATCFAYGQTGSGKTHTMGGDFAGKKQKSSKGIYALAAQDVFALLSQKKYSSMALDPYVSFFEIYNGKVFDLLNKKAKLRVLEDGQQQVQVVGLQEMPISCANDVIKMIDVGSACRTSGQTFANSNSSRSHAVLQIILRCRNRLHGKFSLVDLAGNERGTDISSSDRQTLGETAEINCSLLALKECIRSLGRNSKHIPFRMSTLTQVLRDSFIGENSKTCMIAMISPGMVSCDYTLNTLRYADRVKELNGTLDSERETMAAMEDSILSEDSSSNMAGIFEAISLASQVKEKVYEELQRSSKIMKILEELSYDEVAGMAEIVDHGKRLQELVVLLQSAFERERLARLGQDTGAL
ncbi:kinesin-like protein KIF2C isoform X2 [Brienomyrus brachyistius]|uniref:kinesin-like protein KIF2C isoform X2 n=1 Tax=Brienomyrus brachyistius TaxID=42636 RepID=UPI0020B325D6|nr:kinesin-like protein KIF2C isoform X2 [Brienomyrus brachyistius]